MTVTTSEKVRPGTKRRLKPWLTQGCGPDCILSKPPAVACSRCGCDISRGVSQVLGVVGDGKGNYVCTRRGGKNTEFCLKCAQIIIGVRDLGGRLLEQYRDTSGMAAPTC